MVVGVWRKREGEMKPSCAAAADVVLGECASEHKGGGGGRVDSMCVSVCV